MNSFIIHTLRKRSKLKLLAGSHNENDAQNSSSKSSEKQIFTMLLLVTFVFLILNIPTNLNVPNQNTPHYYALFTCALKWEKRLTTQTIGLISSSMSCLVRSLDRFKESLYFR